MKLDMGACNMVKVYLHLFAARGRAQSGTKYPLPSMELVEPKQYIGNTANN
jgi:hypothetical protein